MGLTVTFGRLIDLGSDHVISAGVIPNSECFGRGLMLRIGTQALELEEDGLFGRRETLNDCTHVSRSHVQWESVTPSAARGIVLHENGIALRRHSSTQWTFAPRHSKFLLRNEDQIRPNVFRPFRRDSLLRSSLDLDCLFTFVGDYDSEETIEED